MSCIKPNRGLIRKTNVNDKKNKLAIQNPLQFKISNENQNVLILKFWVNLNLLKNSNSGHLLI